MRTASTSPELDGGVPRPGEILGGKYLVDGPCRQGGHAVVLGATCVPRGPRVALEVLLPAWARHGIIVDRFLREGESAMRIRSEHAVRVLDEGLLENGAPYLVLEHVEGHTLQEIVATCGRLPLPTVIDWVLQATEAIAQAHSYGIVHGDLTPAKMFLTRRPDGTECIKVDFGMGKLAEAPRVDVRVDVRALGAVLDVLLTGRGSVRGAAWRTRLPRALEDTVRRCSSFVSVAELARALAPFGTPAARVSRERIECLLEDGVRELVPSATLPRPRSESPPSESHIGRRPYGADASGRVVLLALVILTTLGASTFAVMYDSVPRGDARAMGVAEMQPTATVTAQPPAPPLRASTASGRK